jgi:hypothetical protein
MTAHERAQKLISEAKLLCETTSTLFATSRGLVEEAKRLVAEAKARHC